ncbi:UGGT1 isoform 2 [Pan troglodytes]|uniref:UGGT1 isoform 2 n=1 Tax=Pan troglodytes TaxID=9598 RepID=A0A2J8M1J9_PANTR|nr:UGGT1 isoform 2 [Pan troglodytes]
MGCKGDASGACAAGALPVTGTQGWREEASWTKRGFGAQGDLVPLSH